MRKLSWLHSASLCDNANLEDEAINAARALVQGWPNHWSATMNAAGIFANFQR